MRAALRQLAKTAALVTPLGLLLYLALAVLAGKPGAQFWLTLLLATPLTLLLVCQVTSSLRGGNVAVGRTAINRADSPVRYWLWIVWFAAMAALAACLCVYSAGRLIDA